MTRALLLAALLALAASAHGRRLFNSSAFERRSDDPYTMFVMLAEGAQLDPKGKSGDKFTLTLDATTPLVFTFKDRPRRAPAYRLPTAHWEASRCLRMPAAAHIALVDRPQPRCLSCATASCAPSPARASLPAAARRASSSSAPSSRTSPLPRTTPPTPRSPPQLAPAAGALPAGHAHVLGSWPRDCVARVVLPPTALPPCHPSSPPADRQPAVPRACVRSEAERALAIMTLVDPQYNKTAGTVAFTVRLLDDFAQFRRAAAAAAARRLPCFAALPAQMTRRRVRGRAWLVPRCVDCRRPPAP